MLPKIITLKQPKIVAAASQMPNLGKLAISSNGLSYLDIDDQYIHQLYPLFSDKNLQKPDYFRAGSVGAHITLIYPEEGKILDKAELGKVYSFKIKELVRAEIDEKDYYVLMVEAHSLLALRRRYGLSDLLCFKGYSISLHITIAISVNKGLE